MAVVVSDETFWAVVALFFLWIVFCGRRAGDTVFTVPEWKVAWTDAFVGVVLVSHDGSIDSLALALVVDWIQSSWGIAFEAFASASDIVVKVIGWAWLASLVSNVENVWRSALNAVVEDFIESSWAT